MPIRRWKDLGPARGDRVNFALHNDRAMVLPARARTSSSRHRAEEWRPVPGRFPHESTAQAARRTAEATAVGVAPLGQTEQAQRQEARRQAEGKAKKAAKQAAFARRNVAGKRAAPARTIPAPVPRAATPTPTPAPARRPDPLQRVAARPMLDPFLAAPRGDAP